MHMSRTIAKSVFGVFLLVAAACFPAMADQSVSISVKNHRFQPAEIHASAKTPIELRVKNLDSTAIEFESDTLHVEKVVSGNSEAVIRLKPLAPGRYEFYDDYHQESTGVLVVR
jgi:hypothetical protein